MVVWFSWRMINTECWNWPTATFPLLMRINQTNIYNYYSVNKNKCSRPITAQCLTKVGQFVSSTTEPMFLLWPTKNYRISTSLPILHLSVIGFSLLYKWHFARIRITHGWYADEAKVYVLTKTTTTAPALTQSVHKTFGSDVG